MDTVTINSRKVAMFSDLHWGKSRDSDVKLESAKKFIDWFIELIKERNIKDVLFLGDWFDNRNLISVKTQNYSYEALRKFSENGINLYMIVGNHDAYFKDTIEVNSIKHYNDIPHIHPVEELTKIHFAPTDKYGLMCPWDTYREMDEKFDVMFGHYEFKGAYLVGTVSKHGMNIDDLFENAPLIFGGHYHISADYQHENGRVVTLGCPLQLDWGDFENDKGVYILNTEDMTFEFIKNKISPKHIRIYWTHIKEKTEKFDTITGNYVKFVVDSKPKFEHIMKVLNIINSKDPIKTCEPEFVYNKNINILEGVDISDESDSVLTMSKLEYMEKYIKEYFKNSEDMADLDANLMIDMMRNLYKETELE